MPAICRHYANGCESIMNENEIQIIKNDEIEFLQFKRLLNHHNVNHAYILKPHNMNFRCGKDFRCIEEVKENLKTVSKNCGFKYETIIRPDYEHTNNVAIVDSVDISKEIPELRGERFQNTDGLITNKKDITLMSTNADCNLVLLFDRELNVIANVHAGWRGTFDKIVKNAVEKMKEEYNSNPQNIEAYFCPSIRKCHFEVDEDVKELCEKKFEYTGKIEDIISKGEIKEGKQKYYIDTILINTILLKESGVLSENIVDCGICSVCMKDLVHSKRAEGDSFNLGTALICLT